MIRARRLLLGCSVAAGAAIAAMPMVAPVLAQPKPAAKAEGAQQFPDVIDVKVKARGGNSFDFEVTISSRNTRPRGH